MAFGVTSTGFVRKRLSDIQQEIDDTLRLRLGNFINLLPASVLTNLRGIFADREAELWEFIEDTYNSRYPDTASGVSLDNVVAITGIVRQGATNSRLSNVALFGDPGTVVPIGTLLSVLGNPTAQFQTDFEVTLGAGTNAQQTVTWSTIPSLGTYKFQYRDEITGPLAFNADAAAIQTALNALPSLSGVTVTGSYALGFIISFLGDDGLQPQPILLIVEESTDSTPTVTVDVAGSAQAVVDSTAVVTGPIQALYATLRVIDTPVSGLDSVKNLLDAVVGRNVETDQELRLRRSQTLQVAGAATPEAIRARLLNLVGVTDVLIFENITQIPDSEGRPPKSFEAVVGGGDDQEIREELWDSKPAGIETVGDVEGTIVDSQGFTQTIKFSRPTNVDIYAEIEVTKDGTYPADGDALVQNAVVSFINSLGIGRDVVVYPQLVAAINPIPGVVDLVIRIGVAPGPALDDNVIIDANEIAVTDPAKVLVVSA